MFKHNLSVGLNMQRRDKESKYPLRLRTTIKRKATYYATGISLKLEQWDKEKREIVNHPNKALLNTLLRKQIVDLEAKFIEAATKGEALTKPKKKNSDFIKFCAAKIEEQKRVDKEATTRHKKADLSVLSGFRSVIPFNAITVTFLHQFEDYCKKKLGNINNTVWGHIKFIKGMLHQAAKENLFDLKVLDDYNAPKYIDPERDYLILSEVDKIEVFRNKTDIDKLRNVADWFLFSCYTGLRYEDVRTFSKDKIQNGKIILRTSKKGTDITLSIHPRLQVVLDRMATDVYSNQKCNDYIKVVAAGAGINKQISMHIGRHSFSVIHLELGGSIEGLNKLLGHSKMSTTLIYGKITNKRLDDEVRKVWG